MKAATKAQPVAPRALSQAEVEACELEANAAVPEDALEEEAQALYAKALRKAVERRRRASRIATVSLAVLEDDED